MAGRAAGGTRDAHRHLGVLPAFPFYGGPPVSPDVTARATIGELLKDMDAEGTERALVIPNYGVPDPEVAFSFNELCVEAATRSERVSAALWVSPLARDAERTGDALKLAGEPGVKALKLSFLLGGRPGDPACRPGLDEIFAVARERDLVVHVHTSPGAASDIDQVGTLVEDYGDAVKIHLVHFGGGMSGHIKLAGHRFFDWIERGKQVYTDLSWAIGFAPRWLAAEIDRRGIGGDRVLFASDEPWGDAAGEHARMRAAAGGTSLGDLVFRQNFDRLYGLGHYNQEGEGDTMAELTETEQQSLNEIPHPSLPDGSSLYGGTKVFPDYQAEPGQSYFTLVHGIAHESSVSFVAILQATRALRKGFETAIYFYGPGAMNCMATRGFPATGNSAFPGEHNINEQLKTFIKEGGKVYCCRFGLSLHGLREEDLIEGVIPTHPLDVQDALIHYSRKGAIINSTYMW